MVKNMVYEILEFQVYYLNRAEFNHEHELVINVTAQKLQRAQLLGKH